MKPNKPERDHLLLRKSLAHTLSVAEEQRWTRSLTELFLGRIEILDRRHDGQHAEAGRRRLHQAGCGCGASQGYRETL